MVQQEADRTLAVEPFNKRAAIEEAAITWSVFGKCSIALDKLRAAYLHDSVV